MADPLWLIRLMDEKAELDLRLSKLEVFLEGGVFAALTRYQQSLLRNQAYCMRWYSNILAERIQISEDSQT